ncbi:MAG: winged helix-turn-helix transcriptional regulator, partial [Nitrososphaerales archaeon]
MGKIDDIDMKILKELVSDASLSVPKLSKKINVNPSVVYSRIKRLVKRGLIKKFTVVVNEELLGYNVDAIVGANVDSKYRSNVMEQLLELD